MAIANAPTKRRLLSLLAAGLLTATALMSGALLLPVMPVFAEDGRVTDPILLNQLDILAQQVVGFARMRALDELARASAGAEASE